MHARIPPSLRAFGNRLVYAYRRVFSVGEIQNSSLLQLLLGGSLFFFYDTYSRWATSSLATSDVASRAVCWPHFQDCAKYYFLTGLPNGYSQSIFYMALFSLMTLCAYLMWRKYWTGAHAVLMVLLAWKILIGFFLSYGAMGMYDHYHVFLTLAVLVLPHKEFFAKAVFVSLYFISATIKFSPGWILGTYFTSLTTGLPIFPAAITALVTNSVTLAQIFDCWLLMSRNWLWQRLALMYFLAFHIYSGFIVGFNYPAITIPTVLILFGPLYRHQLPPLTRKSIAGWILIVFLFCLQMPSWISTSDIRLTVANNRYGMWMFDANHQCVTTISTRYKTDVKLSPATWSSSAGTKCRSYECVTETRTYKDGDSWIQTQRSESAVSFQRCDPYQRWQQYKQLCKNNVASVAMQFDHSINGGPFYRIVDEPDICSLSYKVFGTNPWIKSPPESPIVGYPVKNVYRYQGQL